MSILSNRLRKIVPWIAFAALIILLQCYFTTIRDSQVIKNTIEAFGTLKVRENAKAGPMHILLVAYARTGSSFIGDLIQSIPLSFYFFEPLHFIKEPVLNDSFDEARNLLGNLFTCNVSQIEGFMSWQMKHKSFMKLPRNIRYWKDCSQIKQCFNSTYIDSYCRNQTTVITKTIRFTLPEASKLFVSHPNLNLKVIYLTRDPRGTMNSRRINDVKIWCKKDVACFSSDFFCSSISADVKATCQLLSERPEDFTVIRYEDVSMDPYGTAQQLVKFLGLERVPASMLEFLKTHTKFTGNVIRKSKAMGLGYSYSTFRNSSVTAMSWRKRMSFSNVTHIQNICKSFLSAFGYHSYKTVASLRSNVDLNKDIRDALDFTCN